MSNRNLKKNFENVQQRITQAACDAQRDPAAVRLVAVSKTMSVTAVHEAYECGHRMFGENRVQELAAKAQALPGDVEWHFIGHLQKNKVRQAVQNAAWIHSVDSVSLLRRIDRIAGEEGQCPCVLLEVNVSGENSKFGLPPDAVPEVVDAAQACTHLKLRGMMTMAPFEAPPQVLHTVFGDLRKLRDSLENEMHIRLPELSMGMSADFGIAIAEGATLVRIGSAIFGSRPPK